MEVPGRLRLRANDLLERPAVPVRIREEHEAAPGIVLDLRCINPALDQLSASGLDVGDHHLQTLD